MRFLVQAREQGDPVFETCLAHALVELEEITIQTLFQRREFFQMARSKDAMLSEMHFSGNPMYIFNDDFDISTLLTPEEHQKYEDEEQISLPKEREGFSDTDYQYTQCDVTIINEDGVRFGCQISLCVGQVQTEVIPWNKLLDLLRAMDPGKKPRKTVR